MMARSSPGRFARIFFISSRNLVIVSAVVAICSRRVAMTDYSLRDVEEELPEAGPAGNSLVFIIAAPTMVSACGATAPYDSSFQATRGNPHAARSRQKSQPP